MLIRFWGARGSIPVAGREYLKYGGNTTCLELRAKSGHVLIVDAGSGIRPLGNRLLKEGVTAAEVVFTHAHWDHILGFPFFRPLYRKGFKLSLRGCPFAQRGVRTMIGRVMSRPNFPIRFDDVKADLKLHKECACAFRVGSIKVTPILLSHPDRGLGYRFTEGRRSFVFLTDNELGFRHPGGLKRPAYVEFCRGADLLVHDAEFTADEYPRFRTWGHSSAADALELAREAGVKRLGLFHLNQDRTDRQVDALVAACRRDLRKAHSRIKCFAVAQGMEIEL